LLGKLKQFDKQNKRAYTIKRRKKQRRTGQMMLYDIFYFDSEGKVCNVEVNKPLPKPSTKQQRALLRNAKAINTNCDNHRFIWQNDSWVML
jgi:hypothetical protein